MAKKNNTIVETAANNTSALNGIVGLQKSELARAVAKLLIKSARRPSIPASHIGSYGKKIFEIAVGESELAPNPKDRRFKDNTWQINPLYKRLLQSWMALHEEVSGWIDDVKLSPDDATRAQFVAELLLDGFAPTNSLLGNPAAMKRFFETGGGSVLSGLQNLARDLSQNGGMPRQVDTEPFIVGDNIAASKGSVVFKNEFLELIQYTPLTSDVYELPILIFPPQINKYYVFDLTEEKSVVQFLLKQGYQVFVISWRNPGKAQANWGMEDYINALFEASDAVKSISKSKKFNACGACSGGITLSTFLSALAAKNDDRVNSFTLQVCVLDSRVSDSDIGVFLTDRSIEKARNKSQRLGMLEGKELAKSFAWMRPNDLIWNYVVNNYLMGQKPPAFDVLFWNSDTTNLPAKLHSDYLDIYSDKRFTKTANVDFMGSPIDLSKVTQDGFIQAASTDHITPWKACYRSTALFGGDIEFILSNSGHIQSLVNPPGNPKANFFKNSQLEDIADDWLDKAERQKDSWWLHWDEWLSARSGKRKPSPKSLGNRKYKAIAPAPGTYVLE